MLENDKFCPKIPVKYSNSKYKAFTPIFKTIRWNKHSLNNIKITENLVEDHIRIRPKLYVKFKESTPTYEFLPQKQDFFRDKNIKYSPARFIEKSTIEKNKNPEKKFNSPSIECDLQLIKYCNKNSTDTEFYQIKFMQNYISNLIEQNKIFRIEKKVRFNLI
jgi:hypothetical protein